jgi:hypothetical protein
MRTKIFLIVFLALIIILLRFGVPKIIEIAKTESYEKETVNVLQTKPPATVPTNDEAQSPYDDARIDARVALIIKLVKNRDKEGLSRIVSYPLERKNSISPVKNRQEFIERFDEIFDSKLIEKISNADPKDLWLSWRGAFLMEMLEDSTSVALIGIECFDDDYDIKFITTDYKYNGWKTKRKM